MALERPGGPGSGMRALAAFAILFGVATVISGGATLFDPATRAASGPIVPFVLWFNFLAGFAYVAAGVGLFVGRTWAAQLAALIAACTLLIFAAFGVHVLAGGDFGKRTVAAMVLRTVAWCTIALVAYRRIGWSRSLLRG